MLRYLEKHYGAPDLASVVPRCARPRPRNITVTVKERERLLEAAPPALRCWLLLCSDLAIRSGTAANIMPGQYDSDTGVLTITTKYNAKQTLPATARLRPLLASARDHTRTICAQLERTFKKGGYEHGTMSEAALRQRWKQLKNDCKVRAELRPHDLRRTTVRAVYRQTRDLPTAQALLGHSDLASTVWYLQDELVPITRELLENAVMQTERLQ